MLYPGYRSDVSRWAASVLLLAAAGCARIARTMMVAEMKIGALVAPDEVTIELPRQLVERLKDRVTLSLDLLVDAAAKEPNGPRFDGDFHLAGRSATVGLPIVVEVVNAAGARAATDLIHRLERTGRPVSVTGAWRVWPEHGGDSPRPSDSVPPIASPYTHHLFEIHPATRIGNRDLRSSLVPVSGYRPGAARRTLGIFGRATATVRATRTTVTVVTRNGLYNDVHFLLEVLAAEPLVVPDGRFLTAAARELDGTLLVPRLRAVFVGDSPPDRIARRLRPGDRIHVWGLPRIDYSEVLRRARTDAPAGPLPYEIVVLGVYPDSGVTTSAVIGR